MRRVYSVAVIALCCHCLWAQPSLAVERTSVLIGDHLDLTLRIPIQGTQNWVNEDVEPADTTSAIEVIQTFDAVEGEGALVKQWKIAVFDTGIVRIPSVPVVLSNGRVDTFYTNDIPLTVSGVVDSAGLAPIKPVIYEPARFTDYLPYLLGLVGIAALVYAIRYWRRRASIEPEVVEVRDERTPAEIANDRLQTLESKKLWQKGHIKEYHSELSHIIRQYLEGCFGIRALESTTSEILTQLRSIVAEQDIIEETRKVMQMEDMVKFAKATPPPEIHERHMKFARDFVRRTHQAYQNVGEDV